MLTTSLCDATWCGTSVAFNFRIDSLSQDDASSTSSCVTPMALANSACE